jgi:cell division protein FtsI/penicillin-binding protein 2
MALAFTGFSYRLVQVHVAEHAHYATIAERKQEDTVKLPARRGAILDAAGRPLAQNEPLRTVIADGSHIRDREALVAELTGPLEISAAELREKLSRTTWSEEQGRRIAVRHIVLKKRVLEDVANRLKLALEKKKLRGIDFLYDSARIYPNSKMACHVVGYLNAEDSGVAGIEQSLDRNLRGTDGFRSIVRDGTGRELVQYRNQERDARNGNNVALTIDLGLQNIVETELETACKLYRPKGATVILMEPKTGAILAMANRPNFDLNDRAKGEPDQLRNRAIADTYEPGSTFKIVTASAAIDRRLVGADTMIFCENGYYQKYKLRDHAAYRYLSVHDILVHSSNIGMAKLAIQTGDKSFYDYVRRFGFGEPTGIQLPAEASGQVHLPSQWDSLTQTRMAMGHAVTTTPLQVVTAMSAIANGGKLMMPQIIKEITDEHGNVVTTYPAQLVREVCRPSVTATVRDAMVGVCGPKGTAPAARVFGYKVAGKTGTAQKVSPKGGYLASKYVVSFAGFLPADDPAFVAVVVFDEARTEPGQNYGGLVAAPIFSRIGEKAARYLGIPATEDRPQGETGGIFAKKGNGIRVE